jgi:hypothetical protein
MSVRVLHRPHRTPRHAVVAAFAAQAFSAASADRPFNQESVYG